MTWCQRATVIDGGEVLVHEAAWARDAGGAVRKLAAMAKLFAGDTFRNVTAMAQQIWGGVGFTVEYDVQLLLPPRSSCKSRGGIRRGSRRSSPTRCLPRPLALRHR